MAATSAKTTRIIGKQHFKQRLFELTHRAT